MHFNVLPAIIGVYFISAVTAVCESYGSFGGILGSLIGIPCFCLVFSIRFLVAHFMISPRIASNVFSSSSLISIYSFNFGVNIHVIAVIL